MAHAQPKRVGPELSHWGQKLSTSLKHHLIGIHRKKGQKRRCKSGRKGAKIKTQVKLKLPLSASPHVSHPCISSTSPKSLVRSQSHEASGTLVACLCSTCFLQVFAKSFQVCSVVQLHPSLRRARTGNSPLCYAHIGLLTIPLFNNIFGKDHLCQVFLEFLLEEHSWPCWIVISISNIIVKFYLY